MRNSRFYGNPAYHTYFADPFVFQSEGRFLAIGTGDVPDTDGTRRIFPMLVSDDFIGWQPIDAALIPPDPSFGTDFWAPEIVKNGDFYFLYYSVGFGDKNHQIRVAISESPSGPFKDTGDPVLDVRSCPFAIDANPFQDADGKWYLFYARDFLDGNRPGTSLVVAPLHDMRTAPNEFSVVGRAGHDWQRFERNRPIYDGVYDWHTMEGPCTIRHEGKYYCIYSGGNWQNESYGLDYLTSDSVMGPYVDSNDGTGPRLLKTVPKKVIGPGHNSVVVGPNHVTQYIAYHAWDAAKDARRLCFDVLDWTPEGPRCEGPTWEPKVVDW